MRKPRLVPTSVIAAATVGLLFGAYMLYSHFMISAPLDKAIASVNGVAESGKPDVNESRIKVTVGLEKNASLKQVYRDVAAAGRDSGGDRKLELDIQAASAAELDEMWQGLLFQVAEAMENKTYSAIPVAVEQAAKQYGSVEALTEMDESNVYITLRKDGAAKYMVLPRNGASVGVWSHA